MLSDSLGCQGAHNGLCDSLGWQVGDFTSFASFLILNEIMRPGRDCETLRHEPCCNKLDQFNIQHLIICPPPPPAQAQWLPEYRNTDTSAFLSFQLARRMEGMEGSRRHGQLYKGMSPLHKISICLVPVFPTLKERIYLRILQWRPVIRSVTLTTS